MNVKEKARGDFAVHRPGSERANAMASTQALSACDRSRSPTVVGRNAIHGLQPLKEDTLRE
jgi:hypothetical protein